MTVATITTRPVLALRKSALSAFVQAAPIAPGQSLNDQVTALITGYNGNQKLPTVPPGETVALTFTFADDVWRTFFAATIGHGSAGDVVSGLMLAAATQKPAARPLPAAPIDIASHPDQMAAWLLQAWRDAHSGSTASDADIISILFANTTGAKPPFLTAAKLSEITGWQP